LAKLVETDDQVTFSKQIEEDISGPVILINKFTVDSEDATKFLKAWANDAQYFKRQPGFISAQLHQGVGGSGVFVNYAVWESSAQLKKALNNIDLKDLLSDYPSSTVVSPHLFKKVAVSGICVD
jgi:quinol monooxygenase YgiN